jgi:hypothetical protein
MDFNSILEHHLSLCLTSNLFNFRYRCDINYQKIFLEHYKSGEIMGNKQLKFSNENRL